MTFNKHVHNTYLVITFTTSFKPIAKCSSIEHLSGLSDPVGQNYIFRSFATGIISQ